MSATTISPGPIQPTKVVNEDEDTLVLHHNDIRVDIAFLKFDHCLTFASYDEESGEPLPLVGSHLDLAANEIEALKDHINSLPL